LLFEPTLNPLKSSRPSAPALWAVAIMPTSCAAAADVNVVDPTGVQVTPAAE
jgi:hypothetical protein